jgi:hypothetical protein
MARLNLLHVKEQEQIGNYIKTLEAVRRQISGLEKTEKVILNSLKPLVDPVMDGLDKPELIWNDIKFVRSTGVSRSISAELLLSHGVSPEIIAQSTRTTPFFRYVTKSVSGDSTSEVIPST